jgi:hypothetical protein
VPARLRAPTVSGASFSELRSTINATAVGTMATMMTIVVGMKAMAIGTSSTRMRSPLRPRPWRKPSRSPAALARVVIVKPPLSKATGREQDDDPEDECPNDARHYRSDLVVAEDRYCVDAFDPLQPG